MRFIRRFLIFLTLVIALAAVLVAAAFIPAIQTLIAEHVLARCPGLRASVGSLSVGFSTVQIVDLQLQRDGIVLTLPAIEAEIPLKAVLWDRRVPVRTLVAKGWTLDLSGRPGGGDEKAREAVAVQPADGGGRPAPASPEMSAVQQAVSGVLGLLDGEVLACDASLDSAELEGDVLIPSAAGKEPARVHVTLKGGGLATGRDGDFAVEAISPVMKAGRASSVVSGRGRLIVSMGSPRAFKRLQLAGTLSSTGGSLPDDLSFSASVAAPEHASEGSHAVDVTLSRGVRHLVTVAARLPKAGDRWQGIWKVDLRESDVAGFYSGQTLPTVATTGEGAVDGDAGLAQVHLAGRLNSAVSGLERVAPALARVGNVTLNAGFDVTRDGQTIRVDRLTVALEGIHPVAAVQSVQPFSFEEKTGGLKVADPGANWLEGSLQGLPLDWLAGPGDGLTVAGADVTGDFTVQATAGVFTLRSKAPLVATGVSLQKGGRIFAQGLDLALALSAEHTPQGWQVRGAPLTIDSAGRRLGIIDGAIAPRTGAGRRVAIGGTWNADLGTLASQPFFPGGSAIKGGAASGDFSVTVGKAVEVAGKINLVGRDSRNTLATKLEALVDAGGGVSFHVPVTMASGSEVSEFTLDGTWIAEKAGPRVEVELTAVNVGLDHLKRLAAAGGLALPAAAGATGSHGSSTPRDRQPFWGNGTGTMKFEIYRLRAGAHELNEVAGTFIADHGSLRLERGRGVLAEPPPPAPEKSRRPAAKIPPRNPVTLEGAIAFDAAAELPYRAKAVATVAVVESASVFPAAQAERDPVVEGRFALAETLTSEGATLPDLIERRREEFRLKGKGGIIRLLKINVAESMPEKPVPVSDALATVGSAFGFLLGIKEGAVKSSLSKETDAVLNFTYQVPEIRYDDFTVTAIRDPDGTIQLKEIAITATNERFTGSGRIAHVDGLPLRAQPLSLELQFGARGGIATLLSTAGLLSAEKDDQGYMLFQQPIRFGGTLEQIDKSEWRDVLLKAATRMPASGKKRG